jgi:hypothetical protein
MASRAASLVIGEPAGVAHLRADAFGGMGELVGGVRKGGRGRLRGAGAPGQRIGALPDGRKRRCGRFGAAGHRTGRALELADHRAKFQFEKFQDLLGGIGLGGGGYLGHGGSRRNLGFDGSNRLRHSLSKQTERHGFSGKVKLDARFSHSHVKSGLTAS